MRQMLLAFALSTLFTSGLGWCSCQAGMPTPLPTYWTADRSPDAIDTGRSTWSAQLRWQAISFFGVGLLVSAAGFRWLWNRLARDFTRLPRLTYGRAASFVVLWGLLFVIVLTMISGARELMTPGAWRKQGWTYALAESGQPAAEESQRRREQLERLRLELWQYAALHEGRFPPESEFGANGLAEIPGWPGAKFIYVPGRKAGNEGELLAFEPVLAQKERFVLLTNGMIGTMISAEIEKRLEGAKRP